MFYVYDLLLMINAFSLVVTLFLYIFFVYFFFC